VGLSRQSADVQRRRALVCARGWAAAMVLARGAVEEVLASRAVDGVVEDVWFRGELVGQRRRYDGRLLLAHLARLDAAAAAPGAEALDGRFDEILALMLGADPGLEQVSSACERGAADLPPPREAYAEAAGRDAAARAMEDAGWAGYEDDDVGVEGEDAEPDPAAAARADLDALIDAEEALERACRDAAGARWDGWQFDAFGRVDRAVAADAGAEEGASAAAPPGIPPGARLEYKSLDGLRGFPLDRVNCVNLRCAERPAAMEQRLADGTENPGTGFALPTLRCKKAGEASPPPPPTAPSAFLPRTYRMKRQKTGTRAGESLVRRRRGARRARPRGKARPALAERASGKIRKLLKAADQASTSASSTRPRPARTMPTLSAAARLRSITRLPWNGPRSLIRTVTDWPFAGLVTRTSEPIGKVRWAAVSPAGSKRSPLAVGRPAKALP